MPVDWSDWKWSRRIFFHTGASGIAIDQDVTDLPVPLRLTREDIDFSQVRPDFSDLRITTPDGRPMPISVEWWNPSDSTLLVWTRLDSVRRDRDSQMVVVRGGNPGASRLWTNPFRTEGWRGVWHLGADLSDQTGAGHDARDFATFKSGGEVGECRWFKRDTAGHLEIADAADLDPAPEVDLLVEAWVRLDTRDPSGDDPIVDRGNGGYRLQREGTSNSASFSVVDSAASSTAHPVFAKVTGTTDFADGAFHHLVGMRRGARPFPDENPADIPDLDIRHAGSGNPKDGTTDRLPHDQGAIATPSRPGARDGVVAVNLELPRGDAIFCRTASAHQADPARGFGGESDVFDPTDARRYAPGRGPGSGVRGDLDVVCRGEGGFPAQNDGIHVAHRIQIDADPLVVLVDARPAGRGIAIGDGIRSCRGAIVGTHRHTLERSP